MHAFFLILYPQPAEPVFFSLDQFVIDMRLNTTQTNLSHIAVTERSVCIPHFIIIKTSHVIYFLSLFFLFSTIV